VHRAILQAFLCLFTAGAAIAAPAVEADPLAVFVQQDAVRSFINLMVQRHGFEAEALERLLAKAQRSDAAIRLSAPTPPGMTPSWNAYRSRFIEPIRLGHGLEFWRENATSLTRAERQFGVPAEVIAAIIGVETIYGRNTGNFRIIDVLLTLAFVDGRRPDLYRDELEAFLLWTRESGVDPLEPRGSYAGAIGLPQFMPSSIRRWAVDFDGSGRLDLRASTVDAIGSVANFLAGHGWQTGAGAIWEARLSAAADVEGLTKEGIEPKVTPAQLAAQGVTSPESIPPDTLLALVEFQNGDAPSIFRLAGKNFWVVTRYNRSRYYAMAVLEFATALRQAREIAMKAGSDATPKSLKKTTKSRGQQTRSKVTKSPKRAPTKKPN
jgi:membrane-bound lytic murein transglycosylase B